MDDLRAHKDEFQGRIVGIEPGTGRMVRLENTVMPAYGLSDFKLTKAGTSSMLAELDRAYAKKEPIAVVLWSPHWAYDKYDLTRLADPETESGGRGCREVDRRASGDRRRDGPRAVIVDETAV